MNAITIIAFFLTVCLLALISNIIKNKPKHEIKKGIRKIIYR